MTHHNNNTAFPPEIGDYFCARVSMNGGRQISLDVIQISELIRADRISVECQFEHPPMFDSAENAPDVYGIIGIYVNRDDASAALDVYNAWRSGS